MIHILHAGSSKECTREKRGKGVRRKVSGQKKLSFQVIDGLSSFVFLTSEVAGIIWPPDKSVYTTSGQYDINSNRPRGMLACNHEKADIPM